MFLFGIGFRNTTTQICTKKKEDCSRIYCVDETLLKVNNQFVGIRLILTQLKEEFVVLIFLLK